MANQLEDPNHIQIMQWVIGVMIILGGIILETMRRMIKGKRSISEDELIHKTFSDGLNDIRHRLEKGDSKMDLMNITLTEISTTLKIRSGDETARYQRHTEEWKDK